MMAIFITIPNRILVQSEVNPAMNALLEACDSNNLSTRSHTLINACFLCMVFINFTVFYFQHRPISRGNIHYNSKYIVYEYLRAVMLNFEVIDSTMNVL